MYYSINVRAIKLRRMRWAVHAQHTKWREMCKNVSSENVKGRALGDRGAIRTIILKRISWETELMSVCICWLFCTFNKWALRSLRISIYPHIDSYFASSYRTSWLQQTLHFFISQLASVLTGMKWGWGGWGESVARPRQLCRLLPWQQPHAASLYWPQFVQPSEGPIRLLGLSMISFFFKKRLCHPYLGA
jgi:hypothetical protein